MSSSVTSRQARIRSWSVGIGKSGRTPELQFPLALGEVVDEVDVVAGSRQGHGRRPAQVAVATQDEDALGHAGSPVWVRDLAPPGRGESSMALPRYRLRPCVSPSTRSRGSAICRRSSPMRRRASAAVVDPRRDVDVYLEAARADGLRISHVIETHLHNDYVSGGRELAALTGATHVIGAGAELAHEHRPVRDGETFEVGTLRFRALDTPGHTPEHVSYAVADTSRADEPFLLLTGGSLLVGAVGRTDLLGADRARAVRRGHVPLAPRRPPAPRGVGDGLPDPRRRLAVLDRDLVDVVVDDRLRTPPRPAPPADGDRCVRAGAARRASRPSRATSPGCDR